MKKAAQRSADDTPRVVGRITPKERDEIQLLFERKNGLNALVLSLQENSAVLANEAFYEKLVTDMGRTATRFQTWWDDKAKAYGWQSVPGLRWTVDFETCEIWLGK
jgi:CXXX repeat modification system protein